MGDSSGSPTYSDSPHHMFSVSHDSVWNLLRAPQFGKPSRIAPPMFSFHVFAFFVSQPRSFRLNAILRTYSATGDSYRRYRRSQPSIPDGQHSYSHRCVPRKISPRPRLRHLLSEAESFLESASKFIDSHVLVVLISPAFPDQVPINYH